ncbi:MAG: primase domain protein [Pseudomonadota bacterium]
MAFSDLQLEDLRSRADIVALVGRRVPLRRTGKDFVGLCPFHGEKSPSFYVVPAKQLWHCFGCGETGDAFKFFMKLDGLGFVEAVQTVARDAGVILVDEKLDPEEARRRARMDSLAALMERAVKFYEQKLWQPSAKAAIEHLRSRGVKEESVRRFQLGFGGQAMDDLSRALEKAGASADDAIEAGLVIPSRSGRTFDRFHGRLIVPIKVPRPPNGRPVALGGRFLEGVTPSRPDRKAAKYINSPETPLYQKGSVLFGLSEARDAIRRTERAVVVEGYFDVIGVHQAGLPLAVATCGTSLTPGHLDLLTRTGAREIIFLFDGDEAGLKAAKRAAELCAKAQVPARVATLPGGLDPDEYARQHGTEGLQALLDRARPAIEHLILQALQALGPSATVEERVRVVADVRPIVLSAPDGLSRELYVAQIAERLHVSTSAVQEMLYAPQEETAPPPPRSAPRADARHERPAAREPAPPVDDLGPPPTPRRSLAPPPPPGATGDTGEASVVIGLLREPRALAQVVAEARVFELFANDLLCQLGERVLARLQAGEGVDAASLLSTVPDPRLRAQLSKAFAEDESTLEQLSAHVVRAMDRVRKAWRQRQATNGQLEARRLPDDEQARRAFEERQAALLEESRQLHRRMRERNGQKG